MKRKREDEVLMPRRNTRQSTKIVSVDYAEEIISDEDEVETKNEDEVETKEEDESSMDTHTATGEQLSEYEIKRLENIKKNEEMLISLNFKQVDEVRVKRSNKKRQPNLEPRRSLRIKGESALRLHFFDPVIQIPEPDRKPSGPLDMVPVNDVKNEESQTFLNKLVRDSDKSQLEDVEKESAARYKGRVSKMKILPKHVAKIVPKRICSMAFHPSLIKSILCAADKYGNIGFWDLDANSESTNNGIFVYEPHCSVVTALSFHPEKDNNLYSCSYDGAVRCADFNKCVFDEVYCSNDNKINGLSYPCSSLDTIILGRSDGKIALVDTREKKSANTLHQCHLKSIKCVHCSPTNPFLFCTSSADASVALWDIRKVKGVKSKLESAHLSRCVSSAYFSPIRGQQILTTSHDNYVKVFQLTPSLKLESKQTFEHFNQTGRWLTSFKATWDPKNDFGIVIGSMLPRRRIQIYHSEQQHGHPFAQLFDEKYDTITSINIFHHAKKILASGNSSGKVYIWTEKDKQ